MPVAIGRKSVSEWETSKRDRHEPSVRVDSKVAWIRWCALVPQVQMRYAGADVVAVESHARRAPFQSEICLPVSVSGPEGGCVLCRHSQSTSPVQMDWNSRLVGQLTCGQWRKPPERPGLVTVARPSRRKRPRLCWYGAGTDTHPQGGKAQGTGHTHSCRRQQPQQWGGGRPDVSSS